MSEIKTNKLSPRKGTTQTIGDSGDTVTIPSGVTLSNAGSISGIQKIDWDTTKKTTAFTAVNQTGYFVDTSSAAITVTFPASPSAGNVIGIKDYANTFDTNNLTIDPNGNKIQGSTNNFIVSVEGTAANFIYVDATRGWVLTDASKASDIAQVALFTTATGGTVTTCGDFKIHTFTSPGTFCVSQIGNSPTNPLGGPSNVDYLVVAGGAGGGSAASGSAGGGGGAGGYRTSFPTCGGALTVTATAYPITVGAGGSGTNASFPGNSGATGGCGSNSVFSTITSAGGGGGGGATSAAVDGGSGGGGSAIGTEFYPPGYTNVAGSGNTPPVSPSQGNNGGTGNSSGPNAANFGAGGGGGANATGGNGGPGGGPGGAGTPNAISGSCTSYAGGGGGGNRSPGGSFGTGGAGGGGSGGQAPNTPTASTAGTANTGGGGGGAGLGNQPCASGASKGSAGGSGIVIIRYKFQ